MINTNRSKNKDWSVGATVKIGFLTLRVVGRHSDIYSLESIDGKKKYEFIPYNGLTKIAWNKGVKIWYTYWQEY